MGVGLPFLGACVGTSAKTATSAQTVAQEISQGIAQVRQSPAYVLQPGDLVEIKVFMEEEFILTK